MEKFFKIEKIESTNYRIIDKGPGHLTRNTEFLKLGTHGILFIWLLQLNVPSICFYEWTVLIREQLYKEVLSRYKRGAK